MPRDEVRALQVVDCHAAGDLSRVILGGLPGIPGTTLQDQTRFLDGEADGLRRLLLSPPYGDPAWSLDLVVPPHDPEAEAGIIIAEAMGYPAFSGSNAICAATALLESGRLPMTEGERRVRLECPAGLVELTAACRDGRVESVTYEAGPAFVAARSADIALPGHGPIAVDLVWSGVFYLVVEAADLGFALDAAETPALATAGTALIDAARPALGPAVLRHPALGDMGPLNFVHFAGRLKPAGPGQWRTRTASYVHPGVVCRSPTGTGTSARLALHAARGELGPGDRLESISPFGTSFRGRLLDAVTAGPRHGIATAITGRAQVIGRGEVLIDLEDPAARSAGLSAWLARRS